VWSWPNTYKYEENKATSDRQNYAKGFVEYIHQTRSHAQKGKQRHDHHYTNSHLTNCFANEITNSVVFATSDLKSLSAANSFALKIQQRTDDSAQTLTFVHQYSIHVLGQKKKKEGNIMMHSRRNSVRHANRLTGLETHLKSNVLMKS